MEQEQEQVLNLLFWFVVALWLKDWSAALMRTRAAFYRSGVSAAGYRAHAACAGVNTDCSRRFAVGDETPGRSFAMTPLGDRSGLYEGTCARLVVSGP